MKKNHTTKNNEAWERLASLAQQPDLPTREDAAEMPLGFDSRVIARWRAERVKESSRWELLEWLTLRGLAVAAIVLAGSAALSYDALSGLLTTDLVRAGEVISNTFE